VGGENIMSKRKVKNESFKLEESSGNVFADVGVQHSREYLAKAELAYLINKIIKKRSLSQKEAAELLEIDQPKVSYLNRGLLSAFSVERLFKFLILLNQDIEIVVSPHKGSRMSRADLNVRYAGL
jgi:predicted XRE-type DNA-binding protein